MGDSRMPAIGPIRWVTDLFGYQVVTLQKRNPSGYDPKTKTWAQGDRSDAIQRGYVKVWYNDPAGRRVVDRALSIRVARKRIRDLRDRGPLFQQEAAQWQ